jgi:hypothetical protein
MSKEVMLTDERLLKPRLREKGDVWMRINSFWNPLMKNANATNVLSPRRDQTKHAGPGTGDMKGGKLWICHSR